jgi:hypothetical protein
LTQTIEKLRTDLAIAASRIAELEQTKAAAEAGLKEATRARIDAETARSEIEQAGFTEKAKSAAITPPPEGNGAAVNAQSAWWEKTLYGSIGGLLGALTLSALGFFSSRARARKLAATLYGSIGGLLGALTLSADGFFASRARARKLAATLYGSIGGLLGALTLSALGFFASRARARKLAATPILTLAPSQISETGVDVVAASPAIAIAEDALGRELEEIVAAINTTQAEIEGAHRLPLEASSSAAY